MQCMLKLAAVNAPILIEVMPANILELFLAHVGEHPTDVRRARDQFLCNLFFVIRHVRRKHVLLRIIVCLFDKLHE